MNHLGGGEVVMEFWFTKWKENQEPEDHPSG